MGKTGQLKLRLVTQLLQPGAVGETVILCPFLQGLDPAVAMWLGPLAWHDCNAALLQAIEQPVSNAAAVFAGVFCADPFRSADQILTRLEAAGIRGVANLPSISFLDGDVVATLDALNLGVERERHFLERAQSRGFSIAYCARVSQTDNSAERFSPDLLIYHAGPNHLARPNCSGAWLNNLLDQR